MKSILVSVTACLFTATIAFGQNASDFSTWFGRWTEDQSETSAKEWVFQGKENFARIWYWGAFELGGMIHKGTFFIDTTNNMVLIKYNKVIDVKNDKVVSTGYHEEWKIISMAKDEIILSRKLLFSTDKPNVYGDKEHVYVRLKRTIQDTYTEPAVKVLNQP